MRSIPSKLLVSAAVLCAALAGAALLARERRTESVRLLDRTREVELLLLERQLRPRGVPSIEPGASPGTELEREPIDARTAEQVFGNAGFVVYDPHAYFRYASNLNQTWELPEHPLGRYVRRTNSAGEREDHETLRARPDVLVLVTGDSHTDGICENEASYANLLEARLAGRRPGRAVEVINAGVQTYTFYNYLGVLEKYEASEPDLFVLGSYGGNDFLEVLRPHHFFRRTVSPPASPG